MFYVKQTTNASLTYLSLTLYSPNQQDFRKCQALIQQISPGSSSSSSSGGAESHTFPPSSSGPPSRHQVLAAQNVQRGLAAKVQDLSGAFRKKQRVYMQSELGRAVYFLLIPVGGPFASPLLIGVYRSPGCRLDSRDLSPYLFAPSLPLIRVST